MLKGLLISQLYWKWIAVDWGLHQGWKIEEFKASETRRL